MSKAIRASALILLLACSAQAGWMGNGSPEPPPPSQPGIMGNESPTLQPASGVGGTAADGWMGNDAASLTQAALDLWAVLSPLL